VIDRHVTLAAAGLVVSGEHRDAFQQSGFASAVLAYDDGDRAIKAQFKIIVQERQAKRVSFAIGDH
jgi:hypothetical protein